MELKTNVLYYGDNLDILRDHIPDKSIDLIYLDPPFNSQADYNVLFREETGERSAAQIRAFSDFWHWDRAAEETYEEIVRKAPDVVGRMVSALRDFVGSNDVMAYLVMMTIRLMELKRVLKQTGSIYLHCDPTASHYLKVVMDAVFGPRNFRNEIVWRRSKPHGNVFRRYGSIHDVLLFYGKSERGVWTRPHVGYFAASGELRPEVREQVLSQYNLVEEGTGRRFQATSLLNPNPDRPNLTYEFHGHTKVWRWTKDRMERAEREGRLYFPRGGKGIPREKRYLDEQEGFPLQDVWIDVDFESRDERLTYPTQKPLALVGRVIEASSNEGDVVLDPFCGCGTAVVAAQKLGRRWIGIDITHLAITVMKKRLHDTFGEIDFDVIGDPKDTASARALAEQNRWQFQYWALGLVDARPVSDERKKGPDTGIDGVIGFVDQGGKAQRAIVQVKSGHVGVAQIRDLKGVLEREKAAMGLFITLEPPTEPMRREAVSAGFYHSELWDKDYPKVQIRTIEELLDGQGPELPPSAGGGFARAPRVSTERGEQKGLPL